MLVVFHSRASSDVVMFEQVAQTVLDIIHAHIAYGYLEGAKLDSAIDQLEAAIAENKKQLFSLERKHQSRTDDDDDWVEKPQNMRIDLYQRIYPLLQMFKRARAEEMAVYWGELPAQQAQ